MEVYADASCTTRPVPGEEYNTIYLKVNKDVDFSAGTITIGTQPNEIKFEKEDTNYISAYIDFTSADLIAPRVVIGSVVELTNSAGATMVGNIFSFDVPVVPPVQVHDIEIWVNEACTVRPVTGQSYVDLYLQTPHGLDWSNRNLIIGEGDNSINLNSPTEEDPGDPSNIVFAVDWQSEDLIVSILNEGAVIKLSAYSSTQMNSTQFSYDLPA